MRARRARGGAEGGVSLRASFPKCTDLLSEPRRPFGKFREGAANATAVGVLCLWPRARSARRRPRRALQYLRLRRRRATHGLPGRCYSLTARGHENAGHGGEGAAGASGSEVGVAGLRRAGEHKELHQWKDVEGLPGCMCSPSLSLRLTHGAVILNEVGGRV